MRILEWAHYRPWHGIMGVNERRLRNYGTPKSHFPHLAERETESGERHWVSVTWHWWWPSDSGMYVPSHIHIIHPLLSSRNTNIWRDFFMYHFLTSSPLISPGCYTVALMTLDSRVHLLRFHQRHIKNSHGALHSCLMPKHGKMTLSYSMIVISHGGSPTWVPKSDKEATSPNCGKAWYRQLCRLPVSGSCRLTPLLVAWPSAALLGSKCAHEQKVLHTGRHLINKMTKVAFILYPQGKTISLTVCGSEPSPTQGLGDGEVGFLVHDQDGGHASFV